MTQAFVKTCRQFIRHITSLLLGPENTYRAHALYHALLRQMGGFGVVETEATKAVLRGLAARASTILDGGANVGRYSWFMARHRRDHAPLYVFEPNPYACRLALHNLAGLANITLLPVALAEKRHTGLLIVPKDAFGSPISGLGFVVPGGSGEMAGDGQPISLCPLDDLIADGTVRLRGPVLLKLDIEGYEPAALAGMSMMLDGYRPWIFLECQIEHLRRAGYDWNALHLPLHRRGYVMLAEKAGRFQAVHEPSPDIVNYFALPLPPGARPPAAGWTVAELLDQLASPEITG
ncbi:hypothetical protein CHU95_02110 [Niveispirillum lacus]|uniref:Methyltransferase FkbM domain-containing protein n=1 Tax=Niveispirillum lacus TaxID=1981099 RepID=A0A255Z6J4_9PROT|nr:hypothetical protein CHU95_02110 [Niveispirillum lacus]